MSAVPHTEPPLLLVEDADADAEALLRVARRLPLRRPVVRVRSAEEALAYLRREPPHEGAVRPALVLLDLHLPGMRGDELLGQLKGDAALRSLPVIMFSGSDAAHHVDEAYARGANGYLFKPVESEGLTAAARALQDFWLAAARLPGGGSTR